MSTRHQSLVSSETHFNFSNVINKYVRRYFECLEKVSSLRNIECIQTVHTLWGGVHHTWQGHLIHYIDKHTLCTWKM